MKKACRCVLAGASNLVSMLFHDELPGNLWRAPKSAPDHVRSPGGSAPSAAPGAGSRTGLSGAPALDLRFRDRARQLAPGDANRRGGRCASRAGAHLVR